MASCFSIVGFLLVLLAFLATALSLIAPFWLYTDSLHSGVQIFLGKSTNQGLTGTCYMKDDEIKFDSCTWFSDNEFRWEKKLPDWYKASQGLFAFGVVIILACFLIACTNLCCGCCRESFSIHKVIGSLLIMAFFLIAVAIAVYGGYAHKEWKASTEGNVFRFNWAFYLAIGGAGVDLMAAILYTCEGCRGVRGHDGYTRGDVV